MRFGLRIGLTLCSTAALVWGTPGSASACSAPGGSCTPILQPAEGVEIAANVPSVSVWFPNLGKALLKASPRLMGPSGSVPYGSEEDGYSRVVLFPNKKLEPGATYVIKREERCFAGPDPYGESEVVTTTFTTGEERP